MNQSLIDESKITLLKNKDIKPLRDKLLENNLGICPICKKPIKEGKAVLDHSHKKKNKGTGLIRDVICSGCNILLGKIENNCVRYGTSNEELPFVLSNMVEYLNKPHLSYLHPTEIPKQPKLKKSSYNYLKKLYEQTYLGNFPEYPKSGKLTKRLNELYAKLAIEPEFYIN
jgi:hypothetical protein